MTYGPAAATYGSHGRAEPGSRNLTRERDEPVGRAPGTAPPRLSIGALSRATGIPIDTLRTWERRYGFPVPERRPSGHRAYPLAHVPRLRRIAEALARGNRAADVLTASDEGLGELLRASAVAVPAQRPRAAAAGPAPGAVAELLDAVARFDAATLTRLLLAEWGRLGPTAFARERVAPLVTEVGEAWAAGRLEVRHEHFLSERVGDLLRTFRLPLEERAGGPLVILATLPGEGHALGLQMAALVLVASGCRAMMLGTEMPPGETAILAAEFRARAVGLSVSRATKGPATARQIAGLQARLSRRTILLVGGEGAPRPRPGVTVLQDLAELDTWARRLAAGTREPA